METNTIFSYIVQRHLSRKNENIATEALAYILGYSSAARKGMVKLFRGVVPELPDLRFRIQQNEGDSRPDMQGCDDDSKPRVFVENKFWAALTGKQPVAYLRALATYTQPTMLVVVGPEANKETLWGEISKRLYDEKIAATQESVVGIFRKVNTSIGPIIALTSWRSLLDGLQSEVADDKSARSDLVQLEALCEAADSDAYFPISSEDTSDQRTPALILQLSSIWETVVEIAAPKYDPKAILNLKGTTRQASAERIGRYAYFGAERNSGLWLGIHFGLWRKYGRTPLWAVFEWRADEVRALLEPWAIGNRIFATSHDDGSFVLSLDIKHGAAKDEMVSSIVVRLKEIADVLAALKAKPPGNAPNE